MPLTAAEAHLLVTAYRLLAKGRPVEPGVLADTSGWTLAEVDARLTSWPGVYRDDAGRLVGFWGLTTEPVSGHQLEVEDAGTVWAWCAIDPLFITPLLGTQVRVTSPCPSTGTTVRLTVDPGGVRDLDPPAAVVSFLVPERPFDAEVRQTAISCTSSPRPRPPTTGRPSSPERSGCRWRTPSRSHASSRQPRSREPWAPDSPSRASRGPVPEQRKCRILRPDTRRRGAQRCLSRPRPNARSEWWPAFRARRAAPTRSRLTAAARQPPDQPATPARTPSRGARTEVRPKRAPDIRRLVVRVGRSAIELTGAAAVQPRLWVGFSGLPRDANVVSRLTQCPSVPREAPRSKGAGQSHKWWRAGLYAGFKSGQFREQLVRPKTAPYLRKDIDGL